MSIAQLHNIPARFRKALKQRGLLGTLDLISWKTGGFLGAWLLPSSYRARRLDREFDTRFGVKTRAIVQLEDLNIESENRQYGGYYEQTKPVDFHKLISRLKINHEDFVFVDLGSGMGRALLLASEFPFKKIVGVEFAEELHTQAEENIRSYSSHTQHCYNFELLHLDAAEYRIPAEKTIFYLYNSFQREVMAKVLTNIRRSIEELPREVFFIYCNSVHRDMLVEFGWIPIKMTRWHAIYRNSV